MRLAFCVNWRGGRDSGVFRKVVAQAAAWTVEGHEVGLFVTTSQSAEADWAAVPEVRHVWAAVGRPWGRLVAREHAAAAARRWVPDAVYTRHGMTYPGLLALARRCPLVIEINGDDVSEAAHRGLLFRAGSLATRGIALQAARGLVFVTNELSGRKAFARYAKPSVVVSNGIDLRDVEQFPAPTVPGKRMVFLGHPSTPWHGLDRLIEIARNMPDWGVDVVGPGESDAIVDMPSNVIMHGLLDAPEYQPLLGAADLAVGSLAMERAGISEGSPLKVREYLAAGIPAIIGYTDTDFPDGAPFLLQLPLGLDAVAAAELIRGFAQQWAGRRVSRDAVGHIDVTKKERARLEFIASVVPGGLGF